MPSSNTITSSEIYSFVAGTRIKSAEVNSTISVFRGHSLPVSTDTSTAASSGTYDLGASDHYWRNSYTQFEVFPEQSTVTSNPPAGFRSMYIKADGITYTRTSAGTETAVGSALPAAAVTATSLADFGAIVQGRLTVTTGTPVPVVDATSTTIYFSPYKGDVVSIYDGSKWVYRNFTEASISVPATTATMYDVFGVYTGSAFALTLTAWTNDTTRATALATQNGVYVKTGAATNLYLGSFRTASGSVAGTVEDTRQRRNIWNYYNRVRRQMRVIETTNTWNYTTASFRQANGSTSNQLDVVVGVSEDQVEVNAIGAASHSATNVDAAVGIGIDSTTVNSAHLFGGTKIGTTRGYLMAFYQGPLAAGRHTIVWLEYSEATGTTTWAGDNGAVYIQTGILGSVWG
jgi:hypothetical protein